MTEQKSTFEQLKDRLREQLLLNPQLAFTILVAVLVWTVFALSEENYASARNVFAILEGFAVLGLATLGLTVTIIAGEIDLSIGSMAALVGVIVVIVVVSSLGSPLPTNRP